MDTSAWIWCKYWSKFVLGSLIPKSKDILDGFVFAGSLWNSASTDTDAGKLFRRICLDFWKFVFGKGLYHIGYSSSFKGMVSEQKKGLANLHFLTSKKQAKDKTLARFNYEQVNLQGQQNNLQSG